MDKSVFCIKNSTGGEVWLVKGEGDCSGERTVST
jgi:hypothetical protein